jgi:hypothetical protein
MAKLIYETDAGKKVTFEIAEQLITELESLHNVNALSEMFKILQAEVIALNALEVDKKE